MASARRTGTNEQITTYGNCTRTYTSLATWEAATDTDHVTDTENDVLECYDDSASFADSVTLAGATNDATYARIIRPASGQGHDGTSNNGVTFDPTSAAMISATDGFGHIQDLIVSVSATAGGGNIGAIQPATVAGLTLTGVIVFDVENTGGQVVHGFRLQIGTTLVLCLAENSEGDGFQINSGTICRMYNCNAIGNGDEGFTTAASNVHILKNCLSDGNTNAEFTGTYATGTEYNASSDTSAPGTNSRTSQTFTYVNSGGNDFHLDAADAGADNFGVDLSGDGSFDFDDDIDGELFATWDIGFDENAVASAPVWVGLQEGVGFAIPRGRDSVIGY